MRITRDARPEPLSGFQHYNGAAGTAVGVDLILNDRANIRHPQRRVSGLKERVMLSNRPQ